MRTLSEEDRLLLQVFELIQSGQPQEALDVLDRAGLSYPAFHNTSEWWRLRGLAYSHLPDMLAAQSAYEKALQLAPEGSLFMASACLGYGSLLGNAGQRKEAMAAYTRAQHIFRSMKHYQGWTLASYNLGWSLLTLNEVDQAAQVFEEALVASGKQSGLVNRPLLLFGRSVVASLRGDHELAKDMAHWMSTFEDGLSRVQAFRRLAEECWLTANHQEALSFLQQAMEHPAYTGLQAQRVRVLYALIKGKIDHGLLTGLLPEDQVRVLLFLAEEALIRGQEEKAVDDLSRAVDLGELHVLALMCPLLRELPHLPQWPLPAVQVTISRQIRIFLRGIPRLTVNGFPVATTLPAKAAALTASLIQNGPQTAEVLAAQVLNSEKRSEVSRLLQLVNLLVGDRQAVEYNSVQGTYALSPRWKWVLDSSGKGEVLRGLDCSFTRELAREY